MPFARALAASFAALALGWAGAADAQPAPTFTIAACPDANIHEAADQRIVDAAIGDFSQRGYAALERHVSALHEVLAHAPACYPQIEQRGADLVVRTDELSEYLIISALLTNAAEERGERVSASMTPNTYLSAYFVLASRAVEARRYEEAIELADRGLALQPRHQFLAMERVSALIGLRRLEEAHAALRAALDDPSLALTLDRPRFLRNDGIVLIDLNRLDEAEAALNESIRLQPDNPVAHSELTYIARLRAGGERRDAEITAPNAPQPQPQKQPAAPR
jgi:tetratricopeptide (TPR) repeat protein